MLKIQNNKNGVLPNPVQTVDKAALGLKSKRRFSLSVD